MDTKINKLIIFDCDGVLVDSQIFLNRVDAEVFTSMGYPISVEDSIKKFTGKNENTIHEMILKESGVDIPASLIKDRQDEAIQSYENEIQPLLLETLEKIREQKIPICVASSSPKSRVVRFLYLSGLLPFFTLESIFTSEEVRNGKPAPDLFLHAAKQMQFPPSHCLVIEDSPAGLQAAEAAHMQPIAFLGGTHAQSNWYKERINAYGLPTAETEKDLLKLIDQALLSPPKTD